MDIVFLLAAGAAGGFIAGLVGVGGGIVFGPVLFFWFQSKGIADPLLTPLTLGSSLLSTFLAGLSGAVAQWRRKAIDWQTALVSGGSATVVVTLMTVFVTTKAWYSKEEFQVVLAVVLIAIVARMLTQKDRMGGSLSRLAARRHPALLTATGAGAGAIAAAAGVGGGVIMVPAFSGLVQLPLKVAAGTSTAAIALIAAVGMFVLVAAGINADVPPTALGYVDMRALLLGVPAIVTANLGVAVAHRINVRWVRYSFAAFAAVVAGRLLWSTFA